MSSAKSSYEILAATVADVSAILDLQAENLPDRGGTLSMGFSQAQFATAMADMPLIIARRDGRLVGYLMATSIAAMADAPILQALLRLYPGSPDAYIYGPICVATSERGNGVAGAMYAALRAKLPGREGILFIRQDNAASLRAHTKLGMQTVAEFVHADVAFVGLSYTG